MNPSITSGSAVRIAAQTSMRIATRNPIASTRAVFVPNAATKKIHPVSTTIPIHRGMDVIGKKFAGTAAKSLIGARLTARILMVTGNITRPASIAGMALATIAAVVENINTVATAQARNTMSIMKRNIQSKNIAASAIPASAPALRRTIL